MLPLFIPYVRAVIRQVSNNVSVTVNPYLLFSNLIPSRSSAADSRLYERVQHPWRVTFIINNARDNATDTCITAEDFTWWEMPSFCSYVFYFRF